MRPLPFDVAILRSEQSGRATREALQPYVDRDGEAAEHIRRIEQATKPSRVGPLFMISG
jgi:hypothetical protein